jgi:RimJ/RimL family protein N-acetyltransferase
MMILETDRLLLREMTGSDFPALCKILLDEEVMTAYEGAFSLEEAQAWLDRQLERYKETGFGLWAVVLKETGDMIGQCGLTLQDTPGGQVLEIGYLFQKAYWKRGYATEAAFACRDYAFTSLNAEEVYSIIRDTNTPSQNVAKRIGMTSISRFVKHYRGADLGHLLFRVQRTEKTRSEPF